mmetsp:Transcript_71194/g.212349  ORF Transcript_71194/g.212349 Transcript_71194/m.212349 type:complete len:239 (+) Transcript_71194:93-809(+)
MLPLLLLRGLRIGCRRRGRLAVGGRLRPLRRRLRRAALAPAAAAAAAAAHAADDLPEDPEDGPQDARGNAEEDVADGEEVHQEDHKVAEGLRDEARVLRHRPLESTDGSVRHRIQGLVGLRALSRREGLHVQEPALSLVELPHDDGLLHAGLRAQLPNRILRQVGRRGLQEGRDHGSGLFCEVPPRLTVDVVEQLQGAVDEVRGDDRLHLRGLLLLGVEHRGRQDEAQQDRAHRRHTF